MSVRKNKRVSITPIKWKYFGSGSHSSSDVSPYHIGRLSLVLICDVAAGTTWATSRTNENMRRRQLEPSQSFSPACLRSSTRFNFVCMRAVKTGMTNVVGHFCSHIRTVSQAAPAAMSQCIGGIREPGFTETIVFPPYKSLYFGYRPQCRWSYFKLGSPVYY